MRNPNYDKVGSLVRSKVGEPTMIIIKYEMRGLITDSPEKFQCRYWDATSNFFKKDYFIRSDSRKLSPSGER
jgi:uncharacterized protein YodC (DUF2158 family)